MSRSVVLTGPNGAGKTNLLEAISFLAPGPRPAARPARRDRSPRAAGRGGDAAPGRSPPAVATPHGAVRIGTGREATASGGERRVVRIDGVAGAQPDGARRARQSGLADAADGPAVHRGGGGAAALSRPPGPRLRSGACRALRRLRPGDARARQAAARGAVRCGLARRARGEHGAARRRHRGGAARRRGPARRGLRRGRRRLSARPAGAGRDGRGLARPSAGARRRGQLARAPRGEPASGCRERRRRGRPASLRPRGAPRRDRRCGGAMLDRRAEGAAHRHPAWPMRGCRRRCAARRR